ncbi:Ima1 N-terminal domain-containing protein [Dactylonectria estremocensis]|uniref:Ima1 N-terminal domain-containing protein n=1 Tax=Dactylonectria estremocensis TaxID=1079267 RepID=A0A9P9IWB6_9HYPO|nr:Ima1 N-terminal domain-containing protein [Dactylonectria estremocensis]
MPRLRGTRYLTCFYCGKRSNTKFDGITRDFLCLYCDATNYLDENGDITDPPVATEREAPATLYADPRPSSPDPSQDSIFCATCLKNQRLFTSSLAQYLPEDPSHPDYAELERNYYRFRKGLEERYPQVCDECAERVDGRIAQAGYTAKTDHLRRMMEKSRGRRDVPGKVTALDWANILGRGLWWAGLVVQMLWHAKAVSAALGHRDEGMYDPDDMSWPTLATICLAWVVAFLPPADTLINLAVLANVLSVWWNPKFVQFSRGFTRHLLGFTQWYSFQGLIIFFRLLFRRVLELDGGKAQSRGAQLSAHLGMAVVMNLIYTLARRSIRVDTTPLFGTYSTTVSPRPRKTLAKKREEPKSLSELLNEALDSPTATPPRDTLGRPPVNSLPPPYPPSNPIRPRSTLDQFGTLGISGAPLRTEPPLQTEQVQYSDEMDWTPTQAQSSPHRAFRDDLFAPTRAFGAAPVAPEGNPFWYKVPAAPTNPAQRMRNPVAPVLRSKPAEEESVFFRANDKSKTQTEKADAASVAFKPPSFFAPAAENDEASSLADLLGQSFSLGQENPQPVSTRIPKYTSVNRRTDMQIQSPLGVELIIIACLLVLWLGTVLMPFPFRRELQLAALSAAGTIALRVTGETSHETREEEAPSVSIYVGSVLSVIELAAVCWLGWEVWKGEVDTSKYGIGVLVAMLGHQLWNNLI